MKRARNHRKSVLFPLIVAALLLSGATCSTPQVDSSEAGTATTADGAERAVEAAEIARSIQADPDSMEQVLVDAGMTRQDFEDLLYEIAADPDLSEAYARRLEE